MDLVEMVKELETVVAKARFDAELVIGKGNRSAATFSNGSYVTAAAQGEER